MLELDSNRLQHFVWSEFRTFIATLGLFFLFGTGSTFAQFGQTTQYFPHFVSGSGWVTSFSIHNPTGSNINVQAELFLSDGISFGTSNVAVAPGGSATLTVESPAVLTTGWARLTSTDRFSASELFRLVDGTGQLQSQVGVLPAARTDQFKLFAVLESGTAAGLASTGVAIANPSLTDSSVLTVDRFSAAGQFLDSRTVTLGPLQHLARFLNEDPYFLGLDNFDGIVEVSATEPVTAVTLRLEGPEVAAVAVITPLEQSVTGDLTITGGNLDLPETTDETVGVITYAGESFIHSYGTFNTFLGSSAGNFTMSGDQNTGMGRGTLFNNTTGRHNTATGTAALASNTVGEENTATGSAALLVNTSGTQNTATGRQALSSNTTGNNNTATGAAALGVNDTGDQNTATGSEALRRNTTGSFNTAIGEAAIRDNTTGRNNTATGFRALRDTTNGSFNAAFGSLALTTNMGGSFNTAIGAGANVASPFLENATAIGYQAIVDAANKVRIGNDLVTAVETPVGVTTVSDKNRKQGFLSIDSEDVLKKVVQIPVTSWNYIGHDPAQFRHYGPMAQDFFAAFGHDGVGTVGSATTITSSDLSGILMLAVQALEKRTIDLQAENARLKARIDVGERSRTEGLDLKERIERLEQLFAAHE